jgi:hypothetical protein
MRIVYILLIAFTLFSCARPAPDKSAVIQNQVDSLKIKLAQSYKPDFGIEMLGIQMHHSKMWFAAQNKNWKLADYQVGEMLEAVDNLVKYQPQRRELMMMGMLTRALDSVRVSIQEHNLPKFTKSYTYLTKTCNICHTEARFEFNVIKTPESNPFANQEFKLSN